MWEIFSLFLIKKIFFCILSFLLVVSFVWGLRQSLLGIFRFRVILVVSSASEWVASRRENVWGNIFFYGLDWICFVGCKKLFVERVNRLVIERFSCEMVVRDWKAWRKWEICITMALFTDLAFFFYLNNVQQLMIKSVYMKIYRND